MSVAVGVKAGRAPVDASGLVKVFSRAAHAQVCSVTVEKLRHKWTCLPGERSRARARRRVGIQLRARLANLRCGIRPRTCLARRLLHTLAIGVEVQALAVGSESAGSRLVGTLAARHAGVASKTLFLLCRRKPVSTCSPHHPAVKLTCVRVSGSWARLGRDTVPVIEVELFAVRIRSTFSSETDAVAGASRLAGIAAGAYASHFGK